MTNKEILISNLERLHTTESGEERIQKNLHLKRKDVVACCRGMILNDQAKIERRGKNYYC